MATKPTPAQVAARKTFADMARSGAFAKRRKPAAKRARNPVSRAADDSYDASKSIVLRGRKANPAKRGRDPVAVGLIASQILRMIQDENMSIERAEKEAVRLYGDTYGDASAITIKEARTLVRNGLNYPLPLRVTRGGIVKQNPLARRPPSGYAVTAVTTTQGVAMPGKLLGTFATLALAKEYAAAYVQTHRKPVGITGKK